MNRISRKPLLLSPKEVKVWEWDKKFSVGVDAIDKQHLQLVNLINKIEELKNKEPIDVKKVSMIIQELIVYTQSHFTQEEEVMRRHAFVGIERHKKLHQTFIEKVKLFEEKFEKGPQQVLDIMLPFLTKWLQHHIMVEDKKYSINVGEKFKL